MPYYKKAKQAKPVSGLAVHRMAPVQFDPMTMLPVPTSSPAGTKRVALEAGKSTGSAVTMRSTPKASSRKLRTTV